MYNKNQLKIVDKLLAKKFAYIISKTNYRFLFNSIIGIVVSIDTWPREDVVLELLKKLPEDDQHLFKLLFLCYPQKINSVNNTLKEEGISFLINAGLVKKEQDLLIPTGYSILPINDMLLIVSLPYSYSQSKTKAADIYLGQDSMRLMQMVTHRKYKSVLDLCAGSGIQGMALKNVAKKIYAVEINHNTLVAIRLNQMLNNISEEQYCVLEGDIYSPVDVKEQFECILSNPPYVPVPENMELPICGAGGEDGLKFANKIIDGYKKFLQKNGYAYMVLECIGNEKHPYVLDYMKNELKQGCINVSLINKMPIEAQIDFSVSMAVSYYDQPQKADYYRKIWEDIFRKHKATAMYSAVIEYIKTDEPLQINIVHNYNQWAPTSHFRVREDAILEEECIAYYHRRYPDYDGGYIQKKILDLLLENKDKTVYEICKELNSEDFMPNTLKEVINTLINLEARGIIQRVEI